MRPKPIEINRLIETGRLSNLSPIALISEKLGIRWLMIFNEYIYGPTPGIVEALDLLLTKLRPRTVLDLFAGSGALSKLALLRGVKHVRCVEKYAEALKLNLGGLRRVEVIEGDAMDFLGEGKYDMVVIDPPEELIDPLLKRVDEIREMFKLAALLWLGSWRDAGPRIKSLKGKRMTSVIEAWGDALAILWKRSCREKIKIVERALR